VHHGAGVTHAWRRLLALLGLVEHVAHDRPQTARGVEPDFERLGGEEFMHARNPESLDRVQIGAALRVQLTE
jgi:hypothetical protein